MGKTGRKIKRAQKPAQPITPDFEATKEHLSLPDGQSPSMSYSANRGLALPKPAVPATPPPPPVPPDRANQNWGRDSLAGIIKKMQQQRADNHFRPKPEENSSSAHSLILSGLLAALSFLIFCLTLVPLIQIIAVLFTPVPITYLSMRFGIKSGLLASLVGAAMTAMFMGPMQAYFYFSLFAVVGVVTGWLCRKNLDPIKLLLLGTALLTLVNIVSYYGIERTLGLEDFIKEARKGTVESLRWGSQKMLEWGNYKPDEKEALLAQAEIMIHWADLWLRLPLFIFVTASFSTYFLNHTVSSMLFNRMGFGGLPPLPAFPLWRASSWMGLLLIMTIIMEPVAAPAPSPFQIALARPLHLGMVAPAMSSATALAINTLGRSITSPPPGLFYLLLINLKLILSITLYLFGLSVSIFMLWVWKLPALFRLATLILSFPFFGFFILLGAMDSFMDFRGLQKLQESAGGTGLPSN